MVHDSIGNENDMAQFAVCPLRPIFRETSPLKHSTFLKIINKRQFPFRGNNAKLFKTFKGKPRAFEHLTSFSWSLVFTTIYIRQKNLLYWTFASLIRYFSHKRLSFLICFSNIGYQIKVSFSCWENYLTWIYFCFQSQRSNLVWLNVALVSAGLGIKHHLPTKPSSLFLCNSYKSWYSDIKLKDGTKNKSHWFTFELLQALKSSLTNADRIEGSLAEWSTRQATSHDGHGSENVTSGQFSWRWGTPGRWDNLLMWGNPPLQIISHFNLITFTW